MATGLFAIMCPDCGSALSPTLPDETDCPACGQRFLTRFGHVIPVRKGAVGQSARPGAEALPSTARSK